MKESLFEGRVIGSLRPAPFTFQSRGGSVNWEQIKKLNIDNIIHNVDVKELEVASYIPVGHFTQHYIFQSYL